MKASSFVAEDVRASGGQRNDKRQIAVVLNRQKNRIPKHSLVIVSWDFLFHIFNGSDVYFISAAL